MDATNYAKSPADIKATAEMIAATYSFDVAILAGAICSALVMERERSAVIAEEHQVATAGKPSDYTNGFNAAAEIIAAAIRNPT